MAVITNYSTLQTEIGNVLGRSDLASDIPMFIQMAENKLYRTLNLRNEETALSITISAGVAAVPADFKALKLAYIDQTPVSLLDWVTLNELYRDYPMRTAGGTPEVISREGANFVFGPVPSSGTLRGLYYAKQDPLRTTDPNWYVTNAPDVLLYGSLLEAIPFIKDDARAPLWQAYYRDAVESLKIENGNAETSMGSIVIKANASNNP